MTAGSKLAALALMAMILATAVSPRIRLGGSEAQLVDLRLQDLILIPVMAYLLFTRRRDGRSPARYLLRPLLPALLLGIVAVTLTVTLLHPEVSVLRRVGFAGRTLELFVLVMAVAGLYWRAGDRALKCTLRAFHLAAIANTLWVLYQAATGNIGTLFGSTIGDAVESYGPKLLGEPSAFGTGQFFAITAAVGLAEIRADKTRRLTGWLMVAAGFTGATLAESRISMGAILAGVVLLLTFSRIKGQVLNPFRLTMMVLLGTAAALVVVPRLGGRISVEDLEYGVTGRADTIWSVLLQESADHPFVGLGAGGLVGDLRSEAHNIYLRAVLDFGWFIGALFIAVFVVALVRAYRESKNATTAEARLGATLAFFALTSVLISGFVQDALTAVTSSHLTILTVGIFAATYASSCQNPEKHPPTARGGRRVLTVQGSLNGRA
ncbi:O-antigen ligase [Frigoribacterium sp. PhB24]|uniref:O-antigen ligase family protein n=1 Tax=Frigoribacterium sp. PhB24 TaxID=2485204 RepID=UPI000F47F75A|nr:hypothetical protein [Frigoribacterium sp. PhB24]